MSDCIVLLAGASLLQELKTKSNITDEILNSLSSVFSTAVVLEAAKLVDEKKVQSLITTSGRKIFKVKGSNQKNYMVTTTCLYCSCMSYNFQYLRKRTTYLCKHVLATYLAKVEDTLIDDEEWSHFVLSQSI